MLQALEYLVWLHNVNNMSKISNYDDSVAVLHCWFFMPYLSHPAHMPYDSVPWLVFLPLSYLSKLFVFSVAKKLSKYTISWYSRILVDSWNFTVTWCNSNKVPHRSYFMSCFSLLTWCFVVCFNFLSLKCFKLTGLTKLLLLGLVATENGNVWQV